MPKLYTSSPGKADMITIQHIIYMRQLYKDGELSTFALQSFFFLLIVLYECHVYSIILEFGRSQV
jgi:hypothetical protein